MLAQPNALPGGPASEPPITVSTVATVDASFELAFAELKTAEVAAERLRSEGFAVELRSQVAPPPSLVATLSLSLDEFDAALSRVQALTSQVGGVLYAH